MENDGVMTDQLNMITVRNSRGADILSTSLANGALELSEIPSNQKAQLGVGFGSTPHPVTWPPPPPPAAPHRPRRPHQASGATEQSDDGNKNGVGTGGGPSRATLVTTTTEADSLVVRLTGGEVREKGMPRWLGEVFATIIGNTAPKGLEFARYSIDYHYLRNWLYALSDESARAGERTVPLYAKAIMAKYDVAFRDGLYEKLRAAEGKPPVEKDPDVSTPLRKYIVRAKERQSAGAVGR